MSALHLSRDLPSRRKSESDRVSKALLVLIALLFGSFAAVQAFADDVVFAADENDLQAFDRMLAAQQKEKGAKANGKEANFGRIVREEAHKLRTDGASGGIGAFVREQRRQDSTNRGKSGGAASGASVDRGQMGDMRAFVSEKKGGAKSNNGKGKK